LVQQMGIGESAASVWKSLAELNPLGAARVDREDTATVLLPIEDDLRIPDISATTPTPLESPLTFGPASVSALVAEAYSDAAKRSRRSVANVEQLCLF